MDTDTDLGKAYVLYGRSDNFPGNLDIANLNLTDGFAINGPIETTTFSVLNVSSAGDINGDGAGDMLIGTHQSKPSGNTQYSGAAYVVYGKLNCKFSGDLELDSLNGNNGFLIPGPNVFRAGFGFVGNTVGDANNDGIDDIVIGAFGVSGNTGSAYVIFGKDGTAISDDQIFTNGFEGCIQ